MDKLWVIRSDWIAGSCLFWWAVLFIVVNNTKDNFHHRLIFVLVNKNEIPGKNLLKVVKFQNLVEKKVVMCEKYSLTKFANFLYYCGTCGNCYHWFQFPHVIQKYRTFANFARLYFL